jgi:tetratricopeptide (TPR) repeat protein
MSKKSLPSIILGAISVFALATIIAFLIPGIRERILWRVDEWRVRIDYALNPPEKSIFVPETVVTVNPLPSATPTHTPTPTQTLEASVATPTLLPTATPLPASIKLDGIRYMDQHGLWNYCAPATLAMQLSFWGWQGDREDAGQILKPFEKDKNVMLYEMADFVETQTEYRAILRSGGTIPLLKRLIANGFPVLVEKGVFIRDVSGKNSWMGHYAILNGYDESKSEFLTQDSYFQPDYPLSFINLEQEWRAFNYVFLVVYTSDKEADLMALLQEYSDENQANQIALNKAGEEIYSTEGSENFFSWFNRGTSLVQLQDYAGAAEAYDIAFQVYAKIPENQRPWRTTWYQTGPYFAYFYTGRYQDVINLTSLTIDSATEPYLEENFYWRARANIALGNTQTAIADLRTSLEYHPDFPPSVVMLQQLGIAP